MRICVRDRRTLGSWATIVIFRFCGSAAEAVVWAARLARGDHRDEPFFLAVICPLGVDARPNIMVNGGRPNLRRQARSR